MTKALTDRTPMVREMRATLENMVGSVMKKNRYRPGVWEVGAARSGGEPGGGVCTAAGETRGYTSTLL